VRQRIESNPCLLQARRKILTEDYMTRFIENSTDFAAECACQGGRCTIDRTNFLFVDDGSELTAVSKLQAKCGHVVIIPDASGAQQALLYHTSCRRMSDVVSQIFLGDLGAPSSLPQASSEMSLGALYRRRVAMPYDRCRAKVDGFGFAQD
jgi:hypothetical protein